MNSLTVLLEQFSLPELQRVLRRTALASLAAGVVCLVVSAIVGNVIFGWGVVIGLGLGLGNIRLITLQTSKVQNSKISKPIRALASLTLARLAATTVVVVLLAVLVTSLGLGAVGGIALFYLLFLASLIGGIVKQRKVVA